MVQYLLDTDIFSLWAVGNAIVQGHVQSQPAGAVATSVLTVEEALVGWLTALRKTKTNDQRAIIYERMAKTAAELGRLTILTCTRAALDRYDQLQKMKLSVGGFDLRIAAVALEVGAKVVTRNLSDFRRVPGLVCEDWSV